MNPFEFHAAARYPASAAEASLGLSGREAYWCYAELFAALIGQHGARKVYRGDAVGFAIGDGDWDAVWINRFPSFAVLRAISADPRYAEMHMHREAGLAHQHANLTRPESVA